MAFVEPLYETDLVNRAGDALIGDPEAIAMLGEEGLDIGDIVTNWRSAHHYPLNTFQMTLRKRAAKVDTNSIVAQRIKRLSSIEGKLQRYAVNDLKLADMQDIAGCRVIMDSVDYVMELVEGYKEKYSKHILDSYNDYIRAPKRSGYRGYHLIFRYKGDKHKEYDELKIEMQLRSTLQHYWATAVETVDIFQGEGLKSSRGNQQWARFFALMGSAMAIKEGRRRIPHTPRNDSELVEELKNLERQLSVKARLSAFGRTLNVIDDASLRRSRIKWVILELDPAAIGSGIRELNLYGYTSNELEDASKQLREVERFKERGSDAVLVSVSDAANLQRAFPNYYLDTEAFLQAYDEAVS